MSVKNQVRACIETEHLLFVFERIVLNLYVLPGIAYSVLH